MFHRPRAHVPEAPTNPGPQPPRKTFDVADLYRGPLAAVETDGGSSLVLDEKLRQAYFWIVNHAIISPHYDIEYNDGPCQSFTFGDLNTRVNLPSGQSYSSFVLLPLLSLAVPPRSLLVGRPGRGNAASALLLGALPG